MMKNAKNLYIHLKITNDLYEAKVNSNRLETEMNVTTSAYYFSSAL